jgi:hypothetical protein
VHQKSTKAKTIDQGLAITELSQELMAWVNIKTSKIPH